MQHAPEGPLAHAARVASEDAYLAGLGEMHRAAWERASGARPDTVSKRLLVALSHAIERTVMSGPIEAPTVVVALFQRLEFFDRERAVYERLAEAGVDVVVAFVDEDAHPVPPGVHTARLRAGEQLADEWTVVAVGPRAGAFLVATDQHRSDPAEPDPEAARQFAGRWGFAHTQAGSELARLRFALGDRLDADVRGRIDTLLASSMPAGGQPAASAGTPGETWASTLLFGMLERMQSARAGTRELREQLADAQEAAAARAGSTVDPQSGLANPDFLDRWARPADATTLPVGVALVDVPALDAPGLRDDARGAYHGARRVAAALTQPLGPVDAAVRLSAREFLVVVPGASPRHLAGIVDEIGAGLELASHGYPDVSFRAGGATTVTRIRPLPVDALRKALERLGPQDDGPIDAGTTPDGERIVVACTRLHGSPDHTADDGAVVDGGPGGGVRAGDRGVGIGDGVGDGVGAAGDDDIGDDEGADVPLPRRTAQAALHELVNGAENDERPDVFTDLSRGGPPR